MGGASGRRVMGLRFLMDLGSLAAFGFRTFAPGSVAGYESRFKDIADCLGDSV